MAHTVAKTSAQAKDRIKNKSPYGMPDSPTAQGWSAEEIKEAFWRFILDSDNSIMAELDRVCDEATAMTVGTANIDANAVTTAKIADDAVTSDKVADNAIVTANITDANVTTAKIADGAVTDAKINAVAATKVTGLAAAVASNFSSLFSTTEPTAANTDGYYKFVHLATEPATKYSGWIYLIDEEDD